MKVLKIIVLLLIVAAIGIQFIPADTTNPPVEVQPKWDSPRTQELFTNACADCHSNETVWPWYSKVAPISLWLADHVEEGREHFNINVKGFGRDYDEAAEAASEGWMPLESYTWMHPKAKLTDAERTELADGLTRTFGIEIEMHGEPSEEEHDH